ncbi:MAG TPA: hypothetical protein VGM16_12375 [Gammaproteobacteria bacterium]|jgi:hypothetical protein
MAKRGFIPLCIACVLMGDICGCASDVQTGKSRGVPVLILDTTWNSSSSPAWNPHGMVLSNSRQDELYVEFVNSGDVAISELRLHAAYCLDRSAPVDAGWLTFAGPFAPGQTYKLKPVLPDGVSVHEFMSHPGRPYITGLTAVNADGSLYQLGGDVGKALDPRISNHCAARN